MKSRGSRSGPRQCEQLLAALSLSGTEDDVTASIDEETLGSIKEALQDRSNHKWRGPFAWSLLIKMLSLKRLNDPCAELIWLSCEIIHEQEDSLTLKPFDFEKLICNLTGKLLETDLLSRACAMSSLLFERLRLRGRLRSRTDEESSEMSSVKKFNLGDDFLLITPIIEVTLTEEAILIFYCQVYWLRLACQRRRESPSASKLESILFDRHGLIDSLLVLEGQQGKSSNSGKYFDVFFHHWRRCVRSIIMSLTNLSVAVPLNQRLSRELRRLGPKWLAKIQLQQWRTFCDSWLTLPGREELCDLLIDCPALFNSGASRDFLGRLAPLEAESIYRLAMVWKGSVIDKWALTLLAIAKGSVTPTQWEEEDLPSRINCSASFEDWLIGIGSKVMSRGEPIACGRLLALINSLEYVRSDMCIKLLDGLLRIVIAEDGIAFPRPELIITAAKRMLKLGAFFGKDLPVLTSLCVHARTLVTRGHREIASKIINVCANDMKLMTDESDGSIVAHLADSWCRACGQDGPLPDLPSKKELLLKIACLAPGRLGTQPAILLEIMMGVIRRGDWEVQITAHYGLLTGGSAAAKFEQDLRADLNQRLSQCEGQGVRATFALLLLLSDYIHKRDHEPVLTLLRECLIPNLPLVMPKGMRDTSLDLLQLLGEWDLALSICEKGSRRYCALLREMRRPLTIPMGESREESHFSEIDAARIPQEIVLSDLPPLYQSKVLYLKGELPGAYTISKKHYEGLLSTLRTVRLMSDLWEKQAQLMFTVDWMLTLLDALSNRRLVEYFVKAGRTYATSLRSSYWQNRMEWWLTHTTGRVHQRGLGGGCHPTATTNDAEQVDSVEGDDHPPHITQIVKWLDSGRVPAERVSRPSLYVRPLLRCAEPSSPLPSLLQWAYRCGRPDQVRLLACRHLETTNESALVEILLRMILEREYLDEQPSKCSLKLASLTMVMDAEVNRIILYNRACALLDRPTIVTIRVESLTKLVEQLRGIVEENKQMLFHPRGEDGPPILDDDFRRQWWQHRHSLERRMDNLVRELDEDIMCPLLPFLFTDVPKTGEGDRGRDKEILRVLSQKISLTDSECPSLMARLLGILSRCSLEERSPCGALILKALGVGGECERILLSLSSQTRKPYNGRKFDEEDDPFAATTFSDIDETPSSSSSSSFPSLLCLMQIDPLLHEFPWEACPSLATSLVTLVRQSPNCGVESTMWTGLSLKVTSLAAILNPSGDLRKTEESLRPLVEQLHPEPALIGRAPSREEMLQALRTSLLLYAGHGAGDLYGSPREITDSLGGGAGAAAALLFGCSSGRLTPRGSYRMEGPLLSFLAARSPLILANLWDVTDRDIDRLTDIFVRELSLDERPTQISLARVMEALGRARNTCLLKLLNGFAPVILWNDDCS